MTKDKIIVLLLATACVALLEFNAPSGLAYWWRYGIEGALVIGALLWKTPDHGR